MSQLKKRLKIVFDNQPPKRFVPKSLDGGMGWGVWDRRAGEFVRERDLVQFESKAIEHETWTN